MITTRLYPFWNPARTETFAGIVIACLAVGVELAQPWPIKWLVDYVITGHPAPAAMNSFLHLSGPSLRAAAGIVALTNILLALIQKAAQMVSNLLLFRAGECLVFELRCRAFDQLHRLSLAYHVRKKVGESLY